MFLFDRGIVTYLKAAYTELVHTRVYGYSFIGFSKKKKTLTFSVIYSLIQPTFCKKKTFVLSTKIYN